MHSKSSGYDDIINGSTYRIVDYANIIPHYDDIKSMSLSPQYANFQTVSSLSTVDIMLNGRRVSETIFEPNTNRNGDMYLQSNTEIMQHMIRSEYYSGSDGIFAAGEQLKITVMLGTKNGGFIDYHMLGISTKCKNGDYAPSIKIDYCKIDGSILCTSELTSTTGVYIVPEITTTETVASIAMSVTKWSCPNTRATVGCVFLGVPALNLTPEDIIDTVDYFKELESDGDVGSPSSNQITLSYYDAFDYGDNIDFQAALLNARIEMQCGVSDVYFLQKFDYGAYYITAVETDKDIYKITADDRLSANIEQKPMNVTCDESDYDNAQCTYSDFIKMFVSKMSVLRCDNVKYLCDLLDNNYNCMMDDAGTLEKPSEGAKVIRGASINDQINDFCIMTGTCVNYADSGYLRIYPRYITGNTVHTIAADRVLSHAIKSRTVPDVVKITAHSFNHYKANRIAYQPKKVSDVLNNYHGKDTQIITVEYEDAENHGFFNLSSSCSDDNLYSTNAVLVRDTDSDGTIINQEFTVQSNCNVEYSSDSDLSYAKSFAPNSSVTFTVDSYLVPTKHYSDWSRSFDTEDNVSPHLTDPVYYNIRGQAADWIHTWFAKTRYEHIFEIMTDPVIELGDYVEVPFLRKDGTQTSVSGVVYRLEVSGTITKLTLRSDEHG